MDNILKMYPTSHLSVDYLLVSVDCHVTVLGKYPLSSYSRSLVKASLFVMSRATAEVAVQSEWKATFVTTTLHYFPVDRLHCSSMRNHFPPPQKKLTPLISGNSSWFVTAVLLSLETSRIQFSLCTLSLSICYLKLVYPPLTRHFVYSLTSG